MSEEEQSNGAEEKARSQGWTPQDEFKGDPEKWVTAEKFVERGENHIGILRSRLAKSEEKLQNMDATLKQFGEHHNKTLEAERKRFDREVKDIKQRQRDAVDIGDTAEFDRAEQELADLSEAQPSQAQANEPAPAREVEEFVAQNPWFDTDEDLNMAMQTIHMEISRKHPGMALADNLEQAKTRVKQLYPDKFGSAPKRQPSPVEGATAAAGSSASTAKYSELPPEAKAACDRFVSQGLMTKADYMKDYSAYSD
jgi:hypothetical protein